MGRRSREKGKVGEREAARFIAEHWGFAARRSQQRAGGADSQDLEGEEHGVPVIPGLHLEVKRDERRTPYQALVQCLHDRTGDHTPAVLHRRNRQEWQVTVFAADLPDLARRFVAAQENLRKTPRQAPQVADEEIHF
jgi:hypothetical protein